MKRTRLSERSQVSFLTYSFEESLKRKKNCNVLNWCVPQSTGSEDEAEAVAAAGSKWSRFRDGTGTTRGARQD